MEQHESKWLFPSNQSDQRNPPPEENNIDKGKDKFPHCHHTFGYDSKRLNKYRNQAKS